MSWSDWDAQQQTDATEQYPAPPSQQYPAQQYPAPPSQEYPAQEYPAQQYPPQPGYPPPGYQQAGYQQPGYQQAGYQQGYGSPAVPYGAYPYPAPGKPPVDGISIAALVFGVISGIPLAIGFGIAGLVRTRNHRRRGRWMAVTGLVLSVAWIIGLIALVSHANNRDTSRSADGTVTRSGDISPYNVRIGDCIKLPKTTGNITSLPVVPCSQPHNAQAYADVTVPGTSYPGASTLLQQSLDRCQPLALKFLGSGSRNLNLAALYPSSIKWSLGNHTSHCLLFDENKDITGDIRADK
ncbi:MAG: septum formation family protein [Jatrophihabitans sp.]